MRLFGCAVFLFLLFAAFPMWPQTSQPAGPGADTSENVPESPAENQSAENQSIENSGEIYGDPSEDPAFYIGLTLTDLIGRLGIPASVHAVRGIEEWQDDVVFVYSEGNFYIFNDRIWQIELKSAYLIRSGDPASAVYLLFGEDNPGGQDYAIFPLRGYAWPLAIRFNFDSAGKTGMIFIYRSDL